MAEAVRAQVKRLNTSSSFFKQQAVVGLFHIIRQSIRVLQKDVIQDAVAACLASRSDVSRCITRAGVNAHTLCPRPQSTYQ
jgi:hypothetical protein